MREAEDQRESGREEVEGEKGREGEEELTGGTQVDGSPPAAVPEGAIWKERGREFLKVPPISLHFLRERGREILRSPLRERERERLNKRSPHFPTFP